MLSRIGIKRIIPYTDVIDDYALSALIAVVRSARKDIFLKWLESVGSSVDEKSKQKEDAS